MKRRKSSASVFAFGAALGVIVLGACNNKPAQPAADQTAGGTAPATAPPIAALALATAPPPPLAPAPDLSALPPPPTPIRYRTRPRAQRYRYLERASAAVDAYGDTPPDYTVDYQGTRPWVWRSRKGAYRVVERLPNGERDYYYEPGARAPYLVRDPDYSYAYDNGDLVGVYDADGRAVEDAVAAQREEDAARYYVRANELYRAAQYDQRQAAYAANWADRREALFEQRRRWDEQRARNGDWQAARNNDADYERQQWDQEHGQRAAYAAAVAGAIAIAVGSQGDRNGGDHQSADHQGGGFPERGRNAARTVQGSSGQPGNGVANTVTIDNRIVVTTAPPAIFVPPAGPGGGSNADV